MPVLASRYHASKTYKRMAGRYVYYTRLERDRPDLYASAVNSYNAQLGLLQSAISPTSEAITNLKQMANLELAKEEDFLRKMFGTNLGINLMDKNDVKKLIDTLNDTLSIKKVYERFRALVVNTKGQKNIFTWFGDYFFKQWNSEENTKFLREGIVNAIANKMNVPVEIGIAPTVRNSIDNCINKAIEFMTTKAKKENGLKDDEYDTAFKEFYDLLQRHPLIYQVFSTRLKEIYHFDDLQNILIGRIYSNETQYKTQISKNFVKNVHIKGGWTMEAVIQSLTSGVLQDELSGKGISVTGANIGAKLGKVDNTWMIGITGTIQDTIADSLQTTQMKSREDAIQLYSQIGDMLKNISDGYIIYDSDKNQTMNKGFEERGGFSAGAPMNLNKLGSILNLAGQANVKTLEGIAEQTGAGAIGEDNNPDTISGGKKAIERYIALNIAAFLFDDFTSIGEMNIGGANALHVFNLNGNFVPLSVLLFELAEAAEQAKSDVTGIVRVDLEVPPILYPDEGTGIGWEYWVEQKADTLANTKVSIHFLKNLRDILS